MHILAEHPSARQLDLFTSRLPSRPYCTDDLASGLRIRGAPHASRARYVQVNPPWLRVWIICDVDRPGAAIAWDDVLLPEPAWTAMNPLNGHAHLSWGIEAPVLLGQHDRQRPMRYLAAVESAIRTKLDADQGYSGLITKNPFHAHWRVLWGRSGIYCLSDLASWLDLPKHAPKCAPERVGLGRNVATFDHLRQLAYRKVKGWKSKQELGGYVRWLAYLHHTALDYTHAEHPTPLDHRECHWIAKSVAHWVWTRFDLAGSDRRFSERQAARGARGGQKSGEVRREASADQRTSARLMRASGMTQAAIAAELGVSERTVRNWFAA